MHSLIRMVVNLYGSIHPLAFTIVVNYFARSKHQFIDKVLLEASSITFATNFRRYIFPSTWTHWTFPHDLAGHAPIKEFKNSGLTRSI